MKLPELSVEEFVQRVHDEIPDHLDLLKDMIEKDRTYCWMGDPFIGYLKDVEDPTQPWRYITIMTDNPFALWISGCNPKEFEQLRTYAERDFQLQPPFDPHSDSITIPLASGHSLQVTDVLDNTPSDSDRIIQSGRNLAKWLRFHDCPNFRKGFLEVYKSDC